MNSIKEGKYVSTTIIPTIIVIIIEDYMLKTWFFVYEIKKNFLMEKIQFHGPHNTFKY